MKQYLSLVRDVLENGSEPEIRPDRTGVGTLSVFGRLAETFRGTATLQRRRMSQQKFFATKVFLYESIFAPSV